MPIRQCACMPVCLYAYSQYASMLAYQLHPPSPLLSVSPTQHSHPPLPSPPHPLQLDGKGGPIISPADLHATGAGAGVQGRMFATASDSAFSPGPSTVPSTGLTTWSLPGRRPLGEGREERPATSRTLLQVRAAGRLARCWVVGLGCVCVGAGVRGCMWGGRVLGCVWGEMGGDGVCEGGRGGVWKGPGLGLEPAARGHPGPSPPSSLPPHAGQGPLRPAAAP